MIINRIKTRITKQNKNALCLVVGGTGSGKSLSAIKLAMLISRRFDVNRHVVFTAEDFMKLLNSGELRGGDCVIWDETGVEFAAREWSSWANKAINYVLQTFRHQNLCVFFTVPSLSFVDISLRKLFHYALETQTINHKDRTCALKPFEIEVSPRTGDIYYKYPRIRDSNGRIIVLKRLVVEKIPDELEAAYEKQKLEFTRKLNADIGARMAEARSKAGATPPNPTAMADIVIADPAPYIGVRDKAIVRLASIMERFNVSRDMAARVKYLVETRLSEPLAADKDAHTSIPPA